MRIVELKKEMKKYDYVIFDLDNVFEYENKAYEYLKGDAGEYDFRVIFAVDDYDYVEDETLIKELLKEYKS